jgi:selenocysteine-specific translation elongation factor
MAQYSITEVWSVPYVGTVVNGIVNGGTIKTGDPVLIGPDSNGNFTATIVRSMQRKRSGHSDLLKRLRYPYKRHVLNELFNIRAAVSTAEAGQSVSIALKRIRRDDIRKGMVLVHKNDAHPRGYILMLCCYIDSQNSQLRDSLKVKSSYYSMSIDFPFKLRINYFIATTRHCRRITR